MSGEHRYESCRDPRCDRKLCEVWREAKAEGYREGYGDGFPDGVLACPRQHASGS